MATRKADKCWTAGAVHELRVRVTIQGQTRNTRNSTYDGVVTTDIAVFTNIPRTSKFRKRSSLSLWSLFRYELRW